MLAERLRLVTRIGTSLLILWGTTVVQQGATAQSPLHRIQPAGSQQTAAVIVEHGALLHTTQLLPLDASGKLVGAGRIGPQIDQLLDNLETVLGQFNVSMDRLVKLNVYVQDAAVRKAFNAKLNERVPSGAQPAMAFVATLITAF